MSHRKIDPVVLQRLVSQGKTGREIAAHFKASEAAVSLAKKNIKINLSKVVALEHANELANKNLDAAAQLTKINKHTNELIDLLIRRTQGDEEALETLQQQHKLKRVNFKDPKELLIRLFAEVREQLGLQLQIFTSLYDARAAQEFQREVLSCIAQEAPNVRNRIVQRLNKRKALRQSVMPTR